MAIKTVLTLSLYVAILTSCATPYKPMQGESHAKINLNDLNNPWMCLYGKTYSLDSDKNGYATIPANTRVTIGNNHVIAGYNVTYSCYPAISFVPKVNNKYYANFELRNERCMVEVYREGAPNRIGLKVEPSIEAPLC
jgi:hypothetical protein